MTNIIINHCPIEYYRIYENKHEVWQKIRELIEKENLSREKFYEKASYLLALPNLKVYIPLHGDIKGRQVYMVPSVDRLGDPRWLSYYLEADENGNQKRLTRDIKKFASWT